MATLHKPPIGELGCPGITTAEPRGAGYVRMINSEGDRHFLE